MLSGKTVYGDEDQDDRTGIEQADFGRTGVLAGPAAPFGVGIDTSFATPAALFSPPTASFALPAALSTPAVGSMLGQQWYLSNTGQNGAKAGIDLNVAPIAKEFTGKGVHVGVYDDGIDTSHPNSPAGSTPLRGRRAPRVPLRVFMEPRWAASLGPRTTASEPSAWLPERT